MCSCCFMFIFVVVNLVGYLLVFCLLFISGFSLGGCV